MLKSLSGILAGAALLTAVTASAQAADNEVTIAYQTTVDPAKVAQADGLYEKATGWKINWRKFDSGADVIAAIASADVDIGYVGSSPLAAAATRKLPVETILIASQIGESEALVVRNGAGIDKPEDLIGKKIAVPFVSTTHYSLLAALKHWQIDATQVQILNSRPPEIAAAWARGDIDAAYVWDPALGRVKESGKVLVSSTEVGKWGAPTFDAYIASADFSKAHPDVVTAFVKVTGDIYADYNKDPKAWTANNDNLKKVSQLSGAKVEEIPALLAGNHFPALPEQVKLLGNNTVDALAKTSDFLVQQKKVPAALSDYHPYVTDRFAKSAIATN
ncbi:taurine ABC transporter substrate-binding protein [Dongia soli]|uniref:Taurine ABC transporter substrate-binding protein n=1 Tax=Dongia soli TaxID=600628 RepID=A0ABU5EC20_9PROT|nr:taurine ABC transporter substrate-binding protein [Dongia soli]MDY0883329.1 taurine ABC transporter substrate-binding protein [Dongia soli]